MVHATMLNLRKNRENNANGDPSRAYGRPLGGFEDYHQCGLHSKDSAAILADVKAYKKLGQRIVPIGKAGEVVRGLFDRCNIAQYLVLSPEAEANHTESVASLTGYQRMWSFRGVGQFDFTTTRPNNKTLNNQIVQSRAVMNKDGVFYTFSCFYNHKYVEDGNGKTTIVQTTDQRDFYVLEEDMVDSDGLLPIGINARWFHSMGFYDSEMSNNQELNSIVNMVESIGGDNKDVVTLRALLLFAEKKDGPSLNDLENKIRLVRDPGHYFQYVESIKEAISKKTS